MLFVMNVQEPTRTSKNWEREKEQEEEEGKQKGKGMEKGEEKADKEGRGREKAKRRRERGKKEKGGVKTRKTKNSISGPMAASPALCSCQRPGTMVLPLSTILSLVDQWLLVEDYWMYWMGIPG